MPRHGLRRFFRHGMFPQLMVFATVARLGSVTRAAEELHLAQSTVSTQLKKLAESLDIALFDQQGRGLVLTYAGRELQHVCIELVGLFERAEARLTALRSPRPEVLRIVAAPPTSAARPVAGFCSRYPAVQVDEHSQLVERMAGSARTTSSCWRSSSCVTCSLTGSAWTRTILPRRRKGGK